jgi:phage repressor protein C with HTH and peptisase S24 domain
MGTTPPAANMPSQFGVPVYSAPPTEGARVERVDTLPSISLETSGQAFAVYAVDDSMSPRVEMGEAVIVHPHRPVRDGQLAVLVRTDGTWAVRWCSKRGSDVLARSNHPEKTETVSLDEVRAMYQVVGIRMV